VPTPSLFYVLQVHIPNTSDSDSRKEEEHIPPWVLEKFIRKERVALNYMSIEEMMITEIQPINFEWINLQQQGEVLHD